LAGIWMTLVMAASPLIATAASRRLGAGAAHRLADGLADGLDVNHGSSRVTALTGVGSAA
jgi:hypothetical protein